VSCNRHHCLAIVDKGELYSWGLAQYGLLGQSKLTGLCLEGADSYQPIPHRIELLQGSVITDMGCGRLHSVAVTDQGLVYSWGLASFGRLGHSDVSSMPVDDDGDHYQPVPLAIKVLKNKHIVQVACGEHHALALTDGNQVYAWGGAKFRQTGHPDVSDMPLDHDGDPYQPVPRLISQLTDVGEISQIVAGTAESMVIAVTHSIAKDFDALLNGVEFSDITFIFDDGKKINAHRCILAARSEYFKNCFKSNMKESTDPNFAVKDCKSEHFLTILRWIYTDNIEEGLTVETLLAIWSLSDRFRITRLKTLCIRKILKSIDVKNVLGLLKVGDGLNADRLIDACYTFIFSNYEQVKAASDNFKEMISEEHKHLLQAIIKRTSLVEQPSTAYVHIKKKRKLSRH